MGVGRGLIFSPLLSTRVSLQVFECVQMWVHVHVGLCVCLCVFCSPAAAAPTRDSGSICRELKPDVMQQESPPQKSQVPTAAREITLKHCVCVCVYVYISIERACECVSLCICVFEYALQPIHTSASCTSGAQCRDSPLLMQREELLSAVL